MDALLPKTRQGILAAVLVRPEKAWYASELARRMHVPSSSLQRELHRLTDAGILKTYRRGRMTYYQANAESPLYGDLRGLLLKTAGLVDVLADALKPLTRQLQVVFVYGSMASGSEQLDSDIDLMVVGTVSPAELALPLRRTGELLGRPINPTVYSPAEFARKRSAKNHFLMHVLDNTKLLVIGNGNELGEASGRQPRNPRPVEQGRTR